MNNFYTACIFCIGYGLGTMIKQRKYSQNKIDKNPPNLKEMIDTGGSYVIFQVRNGSKYHGVLVGAFGKENMLLRTEWRLVE